MTPDAPAVATLTRLRFRHWWDTVRALRAFREMHREARADPDLLRGQIWIADPWTLLNVSIWHTRERMLLWSGNTAHTNFVRWSHRTCAELWSTEWTISATSRAARFWNGPFVDVGVMRKTDDL